MSYTAGQWSINDWPQRDSAIRIGAPGTPCLAVIPLEHVSINEQKANAHLISAGPELLGALKDLFEHCAMIHARWGDGCNQREADAAIARGRAAIAAAEGKP